MFTAIREALRHRRTLFGHELSDIQSAFEIFDRDRNGRIEFGEYKQAMGRLDVPLSDLQLREVFKLVDADGSGTINYAEFAKQLHRHSRPTQDVEPRTKPLTSLEPEHTAASDLKGRTHRRDRQHEHHHHRQHSDAGTRSSPQKKLSKSVYSEQLSQPRAMSTARRSNRAGPQTAEDLMAEEEAQKQQRVAARADYSKVTRARAAHARKQAAASRGSGSAIKRQQAAKRRDSS
eukprot:COSAG02_NODE_15504_length_1165_cov_1.030019_1_plen_232_part_10